MTPNHFNGLFYLRRALSDFWFVLTLLCSLISFYALWNYDVMGASWSSSRPEAPQGFRAWCNYFSDLGLSLFGYAMYVIPLGLLAIGWQIIRHRQLDIELLLWKMLGIFVTLISFSCIFSLHWHQAINELALTGGGVVGQKISITLLKYYGLRLVMAIYFIFMLIGLSILLEINWLNLCHRLGFLIWQALGHFRPQTKAQAQAYGEKAFVSSAQKQQELRERLQAAVPSMPPHPGQYFRAQDEAGKGLPSWTLPSWHPRPESASPAAPAWTAPESVTPAAPAWSAPESVTPAAPAWTTPESASPAAPAWSAPENVTPAVPAWTTPESASPAAPAWTTPESASPAAPAWTAPESVTPAAPAWTAPESVTPAVPPLASDWAQYKSQLGSASTVEAAPLRVRLKRPQPAPASLPKSAAANLPPSSLLQAAPPSPSQYSDEEIDRMAQTIEEALHSYRLQVDVVGISQGPVITQFELEPAAGIKSAQIANLDKDLARLLSVSSVRVLEVIPGKPYIGLEIPNRQRSPVNFRNLIESPAYQGSRAPLSMILGVNVANEAVVVDLESMPHLLVAGTTGSGKSVGINVMLASLLYRLPPSQLGLILIDPKMLEMSTYRDIPQLLMPVVTDMRLAEGALQWAVDEMERRYALMSARGSKGLAHYNTMVDAAEALPYIVVVIDELADLMMVAGKKVEDSIIRLGQKARAAGIHLILATQRPSVDVVTGNIKANIRARIAFQVSSKVDSRTILDSNGAEALLGSGDMLYQHASSAQPLRVHGAYISVQELEALTQFWRSQGQPQYVSSQAAAPQATAESAFFSQSQPQDGEADPLFAEAQHWVMQGHRVSAIALQRHLMIDYKRASQLIEALRRARLID